LKRKDNIEPLDQTITPEKFKAAFKRVHEKKASSTSGRHIGHYKAATTNNTICEIKYGTAPERWCAVIDIVASKEGKVPRQHRTRIIQKLEADANQGLLIAFTRPITHQIDKHEMHHQSQLADKQQQCTTSFLQKTLQCEYSRINKSSMAWMETDCTGCYDRMIPNTLLMNAHNQGASENSCKALGMVWIKLRHHVQTCQGISKYYYPKDPNKYQGGSGQGSVYATFCWKGVTYQIYGLLDKQDQSTLAHPITLKISITNSEGFVDDLSMLIAYNHEETQDQNANRISQKLVTMMERTTQKYEKLLYVAGGDLNLAKGHCYILTLKWETKGIATMTTIEETPAEIYLTHGRDKTRVKIPRKERNESCKTLGCHPAPDGGHKGQYKVLMEKAIEYGAATRHRGTNKTLAYMKHNAYFTPGINYPLAVSNIPHKDIENIETKYLKPTKQQMGFRSKVSNALIHARRAYLGIGLSSITVSSDILHLRMLCGHVRENGRLSDTLFATMGSYKCNLD
jgi:hypothetical protein